MCVGNLTSNLYGLYSQFGIIRGSVSDDIFTGDWYQVGLKTLDENGDCCIDNYGTVSATLVTSTKFAGSLVPSDLNGLTALFQGDLQVAGVVSDLNCFLNSEDDEVAAAQQMDVVMERSSIQGKWTALGSTYLWDVCIDDNGSVVGSYEYIDTRTTGLIGATVRGYVTGQCFHDDSICQMDWFEPDQSWGGYLLSLHDNKTVFTQWWSGASWEFDYNNVNNADYHGVETLKRITTTPDRCQRNSQLFFNAYPYSFGVISAIVICTVAGFVGTIVGIVFLVRRFPPKCGKKENNDKK